MKYLIFLISAFALAQQNSSVDFKIANAQLTINPADQSVLGNVSYTFEIIQPLDTLAIDAQNMEFTGVELNQNPVSFVNTKKQLLLIFPFKKGNYVLSFQYRARPKQALYFVGSQEKDNLQIWTQGQGRYTSNWFPSFDDVNEKVIFNMEVVMDSKYQVVSNGLLKAKFDTNNQTHWQFGMQKPMSSYLLALAIGKFEKKMLQSASKVPLELYYEPKDKANFDWAYKHSKEIFDFLEKEIGVKYPWGIYRQVPVRDFLYAGMENTTATFFSSRYWVDATGFEDRPYTNINAHELAHQWFGNLITAQSGKEHWLQEGFATYFALLAERKIYGDDFFYSNLYESAQQIKYASRTDTIPVLNAKASSLSFYQKGAWALFVIHETIGNKAFKKVIRNYLKKHAFSTVNTSDFFAEIHKVCQFDTEKFSKIWLESSEFNTHQANDLLQKNKTIQLLFEVEKMNKNSLAEKKDFFAKTLQSNAYSSVKIAIVNQLKKENFDDKKELLQLALATKNIQVRQAVATNLDKIPEEFRTEYETLLKDNSYQTQEIALYYLWNSFPAHRKEYLDVSKNWLGFNDYNLRTLWLSLAIATPDYDADKKQWIAELINYSSVNYEATTRQDALEKLIAFNLIDEKVLKNLVEATTQHIWQFAKFGRETIRKRLKNPENRAAFEKLLENLDEKEQFQLNRLLQE